MKLSKPEDIDFLSIRNIIFDWGGVITNIDYQKTVDAFYKLGIENFREYYSQTIQNDLFKKYEIGHLTSSSLRLELKKVLNTNVTDGEIDEAWCAMLLDTPLQNIDIIRTFSKHYRIFLLSNTNQIHADYYNSYLEKTLELNYPELFEKVYYSHVVGMRKPNTDIFHFVINDSNLFPEETLFIDDTEMHTDGASQAGLKAFCLKNGLTLTDIYRLFEIQISNKQLL